MIHIQIYLIQALSAFTSEIRKFQNFYYVSEKDFNLSANLPKTEALIML